ncbi:MAG: Na+/H+ antiporter subunit E [candidate division WOR-3 bacterium]
MARRFAYFIAGWIIWLLLGWTLNYQEVIAGAAVALIAAGMFGGYLPLQPRKLLNPVRWFWLLIYIPVFGWQCLKANIDVALRVLSPGLNLKPGIVKIKTNLKSDIAKVFLANSITMTPGTLTVEIKEDTLYIHWIEIRSDNPEEMARMIKGPFEFFLKKIFD